MGKRPITEILYNHSDSEVLEFLNTRFTSTKMQWFLPKTHHKFHKNTKETIKKNEVVIYVEFWENYGKSNSMKSKVFTLLTNTFLFYSCYL